MYHCMAWYLVMLSCGLALYQYMYSSTVQHCCDKVFQNANCKLHMGSCSLGLGTLHRHSPCLVPRPLVLGFEGTCVLVIATSIELLNNGTPQQMQHEFGEVTGEKRVSTLLPALLPAREKLNLLRATDSTSLSSLIDFRQKIYA